MTGDTLVSNWFIRYHDVSKMPEFITGVIAFDKDHNNIGKTMTYRDIIYMDQYDNTFVQNDGKKVRLVGGGTRILYVDEFKAREYEQQVVDQWAAENGLDFPQD